jgi:peptidoglycan/xylan/chitin deacetylase (PgdA/CDA1 family)
MDPHRKVILTFDDGPKPETTLEVVAALSKYNAKALFFVVGKNMTEERREIVREVRRAGHIICNHTWDHPYLSQLADENKIRQQLVEADRVIRDRECNGHDGVFFRPPYGDYDERVVAVASSMGLRTLLWDVDTDDWRHEQEGPEQWIENGVERLNTFNGYLSRDGDYAPAVILMHDIHTTTSKGLPKFLERLSLLGILFEDPKVVFDKKVTLRCELFARCL